MNLCAVWGIQLCDCPHRGWVPGREEFLGGHGGPWGWHKVRYWGPAVQHPSCGDMVPASSGGRQLQAEQRAGCWGCHLLGPWKLRSGSREGTALGCGGWHDWVLQHVRAEQPTSCLTQKPGFPRGQAGEAARVALGSLWETRRVFSPEGEALLELHAYGLLSWGRCVMARDRRQGCAPHYCKMCLFLRYVASARSSWVQQPGQSLSVFWGWLGTAYAISALSFCHMGHCVKLNPPAFGGATVGYIGATSVLWQTPVLVVRGVWGFI